MKISVRMLAVVLVGAGLILMGALPAVCADELCSMGGTLIKVDVKKDKALDWAKDRRNAKVTGEDSDAWTVLTLSTTDKDIAIQITSAHVFFGVAGKAGQEVSERDAEKVFGRDFRKLREAIKKEMGDLWKANVVKMEGGDVQKLTEAAGLGTLEKDRDWELKTESCQGMEIDTSAL